MSDRTDFRRSLAAGLCIVVAALTATPARAGVFAADASARLDLTGLVGDTAGLDFTVVDTFSGTKRRAGGNGGANPSLSYTDDPLGLGVGFNALLAADVAGSGDADAEATSQLLFEIANDTGDLVELSYALVYALEASADGPGTYAEALLNLFVDGVLIDGDALIDSGGVFRRNLLADPDGGIGANPVASTLAFTLEIEDGDYAEIELVLNGYGNAVPAPSALLLFSAGLGLLGATRRIAR